MLNEMGDLIRTEIANILHWVVLDKAKCHHRPFSEIKRGLHSICHMLHCYIIHIDANLTKPLSLAHIRNLYIDHFMKE